MSSPLSAGAIRIGITISHGQVCAAELNADRPQGLAQMFVGRMADEAPMLAGLLFSLCGFSQSAAARLAVAHARRAPLGDKDRLSLASGILAERVFETLRAVVIQWPTTAGMRYAASAGPLLRQALAASQAIIGRARAGEPPDGKAIVRLEAAARQLGTCGRDGGATPNSVCGAIAAELSDVDIFQRQAADCLTAEDDPAVIERLRRDARFAVRPHLEGRIVETGAYARLNRLLPAGYGYLAARFGARMRDVGDCLSMLKAIALSGPVDIAGLLGGGELDDLAGYGAVECARGRLYHLAETDEDGRIRHYRILAPTEWNFHPAGPFADQLLSSRIGEGEEAWANTARLAALFDPCLAFVIDLKEAAHA